MKLFIQSLSIAALIVAASLAFAQEQGQGGQGTLGGGQQGGGRGQQGGGRGQGGGQRMGGMMQNGFTDPLAGSGFAMLDRQDVKTDLKTTDEQNKQITDLRERWMTSMRDAMTQARQNGGNPQDARAAIDKQMVGEINKILTKEQQDRFEQIRIQIAGIRAVLSPKVQSMLELAPATRTKINTLARNAQTEQQSMMQQVRNQQITQEDAQAKMKALNDKFTSDLEACLTDADKAKLKTIGGAEFKQTQQSGRPNGGGAGGNGGGRPGRGGGNGGNGGGAGQPN